MRRTITKSRDVGSLSDMDKVQKKKLYRLLGELIEENKDVERLGGVRKKEVEEA